MKLYQLLKNINARVKGDTIIEITGLYHKDTEVKEGGLFFCLRGTKVDGTKYVESAINNGAVAIVTEQEVQNLFGVTQIIVKNAREAMSLFAIKFYGNPSNKLKLIGVTGTNGKTTTTNMIANVLKSAGKKTAIIGTNGIIFGDKKIFTEMTTPDPIELQKYLFLMVKNKVEYVCMEVSAHALDLYKVEGLKFESIVFTNLTEDHLDYFKTMDKYYEAKKKLFSKKYSNCAVINIDDDYGLKLLESINIPYFTYSIYNKADYYAKNIEFRNCKQCFTLNNQEELTISMAGKFNVSNTLASIAVLKNLGIEISIIKEGLKNMAPVEGRFNTYNLNGIIIVIDYAHTPDGLKNILFACREICDKKLISVFGCGGNREIQKRSIMGEISTTYADVTIITSDNPRFEKREDIVKDILKGVTRDNYFIELDRSAAILKAVRLAREGDFIVLSGKGAENYIDENGVKIPYSDYAEVEKIRRELNE